MNENYICILRKRLAEIRELSYNFNDESLSAAVEEMEEALSHLDESHSGCQNRLTMSDVMSES